MHTKWRTSDLEDREPQIEILRSKVVKDWLLLEQRIEFEIRTALPNYGRNTWTNTIGTISVLLIKLSVFALNSPYLKCFSETPYPNPNPKLIILFNKRQDGIMYRELASVKNNFIQVKGVDQVWKFCGHCARNADILECSGNFIKRMLFPVKVKDISRLVS